jgi:hypothetical protein
VVWLAPLHGAEREFKWNELQPRGNVSIGTVLPPQSGAPFHQLKIAGSSSGPTRVTVLTIDRPGIAGPRYSLRGQIRYDTIEGTGYLEMWNHFPDGNQYFSRTLGDQGPMMKLHGTSAWRPFILPFDASGAPAPVRLVINVVLEGRGVVYLGPLTLSDLAQPNTAGTNTETVTRVGAWAGAIAGAVVGCVGALIGLLTSLGRARRFVIASAISLIALGAGAFFAGIIAFAWSQPYSLFYPLLLVGFLACIIPLGLLSSIRRRYEEIELRTMRAHDLG